MTDALAGRVAIVTGGAGGIGRALGRAVAEQGARVALLDLDPAVEAVDGVLGVACDVSRAEDCDRAVDRVVSELGRLDILVANAGISHVSTLAETPGEVLRRVVEVNLLGAMYCTRAALPHVVLQQGFIAATSSVAGFAPLTRRTAYAASKHGLHGFFDSLRAELVGTGVSVTLACPAYTDTAIRRHALGPDGRPLGGESELHKEGMPPDDVARAIVAAMLKRKRQVNIGGTSQLSWWLNRVAPRGYEALMRRTED